MTALLDEFIAALIQQAHITPSHDVFDFDDGGRLAHYVTARHEDWTPGDLIAWLPGQPNQWWSWRGMFDVLGLPCLSIHEQIRKPIPIWRTPQTWAQHRGHGVCALYWPMARITLARANVPMIAEDPAHVREIEQQYQRPRPTVLLRAPEGIAA